MNTHILQSPLTPSSLVPITCQPSPLLPQESCSHTLGLPDCSLLADKKARARQRIACLSEKAMSVSVSESLAQQSEGGAIMSLPSYCFLTPFLPAVFPSTSNCEDPSKQ
jgi:hypothetical protein